MGKRKNYKVEMFGEERTLRNWATDRRCQASEETLFRRVDKEGWEPEAAFKTPVPYSSLKKVSKQQAKEIQETFQKIGWSMKEASFYYGLGDAAFLIFYSNRNFPEWVLKEYKDLLKKISFLQEDFTEEQIQTAYSKRLQRKQNSYYLPTEITEYYAFKEWKELEAWAKDPRCQVSLEVLKERLEEKCKFQEALETPEKPEYEYQLYDYLTVIDTIGWDMSDLSNHFGISSEDLLVKFLHKNVPQTMENWFELVEDLKEEAGEEGWTSLGEKLKKSEAVSLLKENGYYPNPTPSDDIVNAAVNAMLEDQKTENEFGEKLYSHYKVHNKTLKEWAETNYCKVDYETLRRRVEDQNVPFNEALLKEDPILVTLNGETKTLKQWAETEHCEVAYWTAKPRIDQYPDCPVTLAMRVWFDEIEPKNQEERDFIKKHPYLFSVDFNKKHHRAYGVSKTLRSWSRDSRCKVDYPTLYDSYVTKGIPLTRAMIGDLANRSPINDEERAWLEEYKKATEMESSTSSVEPETIEAEITEEPVEEENKPQLHFAFGLALEVEEWAKDSRCKVPLSVLKSRIENGMPFLKAMKLKIEDDEMELLTEMEKEALQKNVPEEQKETETKKISSSPQENVMKQEEFESFKSKPKYANRPIRFYELGGVTKEARDWAKDPECAVEESVFYKRLQQHWPLKQALKTPFIEEEVV